MTSLGTHMRASAEAGDVDAQFNLGVMLCNGFDERGRFIGVQRDEALLWLGRAAESGLCRAQCRLGEAYADSGSPTDLCEAFVWFLIALDNANGPGRQTARAGYEKIERLLSPEQLKSSRAHARTRAAKIRTGLEALESGVNAHANYLRSTK
jgi:TPR repeat protein